MGQREKSILVGNNTFDVLLSSIDGVTYFDKRSTNISLINRSEKLSIGMKLYTFSYSISGDQPGWISYQTYNPNANDCGSRYSEWDTIYIQRKLNTPGISGSNIICNNYTTYTATSYDTPSETFTWNATDGVKIYKNGQYLTSYTGTETSVLVYEPVSGSGNGNVKVKANATNYESSNQAIKEVWFGDMHPMNIRLNDAMIGFPKSEFCYGDPNLVEASFIDGDPYIDEWDWDVTGGYITIENPYDDKSRATIHPASYSSFNVKLRAHNSCGWSGWADMGVSVISCGGYFMTMFPNPASSYVELSFIDSEVEEPNLTKNKIKLKKDKKDTDKDIKEYLVLILDKNGTIRKSIKSKSLNLNIKTSDLEPGTYFLHLIYNDELYKQQLIIQ
ncbi:T9SS type A sorting domain-containing protein [Draconibacterium halophilum]|uniref:Secretion system C-terminal sorting domain-containing protein n=1 Tax=Draconibacterium halophilum TaxID=2706887 RepID=A0A6C0RJR8_9BACT|nr:hypothetical protein [Draconibacterium halophilum]QIA09461.1 hypothetical protein G0Q07_17895 [Draconibacterium halophilum]